MRKQFLGSWLAAGLAVMAFGACGSDDDGGATDAGPDAIDADTTDADPDAPDAKPPCQAPIGSDGLNLPCPEGGEVRVERIIGQRQYRVTSFLKSAQDGDDATPAILPPNGIPSCFACEPGSDLWVCKQAENRVYEQAGQLTISDGTVANDIVIDNCTQCFFAMGACVQGDCGTGAGATGVVDLYDRVHPDGAYIDQGVLGSCDTRVCAEDADTTCTVDTDCPLVDDGNGGTVQSACAGTSSCIADADCPTPNGGATTCTSNNAVAAPDTMLTASFSGDANGYPATDIDVYMPPDFSSTPATTGAVTFNDNEDLVITMDMPAATNLPAGGSIIYNVSFVDTPPTTGEGPPVVCLVGIANPGGGEQTFTIPAADVSGLIHNDGVVLRGAVSHVLGEYDDGAVCE